MGFTSEALYEVIPIKYQHATDIVDGAGTNIEVEWVQIVLKETVPSHGNAIFKASADASMIPMRMKELLRSEHN